MTIRVAEPSDSEKCRALGVALFGDLVGPNVGNAVGDVGGSTGILGAGRSKSIHAAYWLAVDRDDVVGIVGLYSPRWIGQQNLYLGWFGVHPSRRRDGLGRALIEHAKTQALALGARYILVETSREPASTISFYTAVGFCPVAEVPDYWPSGADLLLLRKTLGGHETSTGAMPSI